MLTIYPEVQDFGDEDKTNYETNEIDKENMNKYCFFIADQKSENTKHTTKYNKQKFCREKNAQREVKDVLFSHCKTFVKEKNGVAYKPATLTYLQRFVQRHINTKGSTVNLQKEDGFKLLTFLEKFQNPDEQGRRSGITSGGA